MRDENIELFAQNEPLKGNLAYIVSYMRHACAVVPSFVADNQQKIINHVVKQMHERQVVWVSLNSLEVRSSTIGVLKRGGYLRQFDQAEMYTLGNASIFKFAKRLTSMPDNRRPNGAFTFIEKISCIPR